MHKNFRQELLDIWNKVIRKEPLALARYGDGELLLIKGKEIGTDTQAFKQDKWSAPDGLSLLGTDLRDTLYHTEPNYYYGIPCDLSNVQAKKEYFSLVSQKFEYITFANLFVNANYPVFKQMLATLEEKVVLIANKVGYGRDLSPLKVKEFIPIDDNCVYFWEKESKNFQKRLDQLAGYSETLFLISAGPLAKVIIDRLWNKNQTNQYIDVGSAIDEIIYKRITRPYQVAGHENANHVGVLTINYQTMMRKPLMNSLDMRSRDGVPTIKEYEEAIHSDSFLKMEAFSNQFLEAVADILVPYSQKWVQDPLHQWSRQWEYAFTLLGIQASIANYSSNGQIHILDAGSGVTFFPYYLANIFPNALVTCIDYDPSYGSLFASINKRVSHPVAFSNQDMHNINAPDSSFDVIYCISVLEHTEDYKTIIQEFKRVLKTNGVLLVSFEISLDGKEGITVESAENLLQNLRSNFSEAEQNGYKTIVDDLRDYDILTTNRINSLNPNLLPWKGQHFASLTFSCHLFKKSDEPISQRADESTLDRQESQQLDEQTRIADFLIPSSYNNGEITVILNGYKRHENLSRIYDAVSNQTVKPREIMLWYNDFYGNQGNSEIAKKCISALTNHNFGVWARFAYALNAKTEYVCIFDDDTIPGRRWFENCLETMKTHEGLLGTIGLIFGSYNYWDHKRYGWANPNKDVIQVDIVGHCWFFKREWLSAFWRDLRPDGFEFVGEDMHFSYTLQKYLGLHTYVPPHPPEDPSLWGSLEGYKLGVDSVAISIINKDDANNKFNAYLKFLLSKGWKLISSKNDGNESDVQVKFELAEFNLIIFPDWQHADEILYQDLSYLIKIILLHPDKNRLKLWIYNRGITEEDSNLILSNVIINLLIEENLDVSEEPEISFIGDLSNMQLQALLQQVQAHIVLRKEDESAIIKKGVETIPNIHIKELAGKSLLDIKI